MLSALIASAAAGYIIGSFPTSYIAGKALRGIDIRDYGSGNTGATNVFRTLGPAPGSLVLLVDIVKGWLAVFLAAPALTAAFNAGGVESWAGMISGIAAVCGHNWPVFLRFRGGKGVAVSVGALLGISPGPLSLSAAAWVLIFAFSGYVSLGSISAAAALPVFMKLSGEPPEVFWFGVTIAVFIVLRHRPNIYRLMRGKENRFKLRKPLK
jgi:acyl phosphate:glycerol-3-phosphate acyltransferase